MSASTDQRPATLDVEFASPMPGLSPHTAFTLEQIDGAEGLHALRATDADVRLFLLDPLSGDYGYEPTIPCLLYTSPSPRDQRGSRMPSSA